MKPIRDRIRIEVFPPSSTSGSEDVRTRVADEAVFVLARLIGRQMARELFQRQLKSERKASAHASRSSKG